MEQATNLFTKGLLLDTHPMVLSNDTLTDCLNGTLITMNGNEVILQNDMGNRRVDKAFLPPGYEPVGMKEYGGIIYVASYNPITNKSLIGSFPSPLKKLSSNTNGVGDIFDFNGFTSGYSNTERDTNLGLNVLKSDSFLIPLTKDILLRAGDKFAVYANGLSELQNYITNYNNTSGNKAYSPKNRKYTLQLGVLNSLNEFVDITKTLCRWKNNQIINYGSEVSEIYKFNDGYFISDTFTNSFLEETIADAKLIKERQKIAANTYAYKLVGPLYLKIIMNHIENFNYNIYGTYNGSTATLWIEGYLTYNCPDGATNASGEYNSNENYATFAEGTPNNSFGFDMSSNGSYTLSSIQKEKSVYNPSTNTYTVKIVKKYIGVRAASGTIFEYVLGVKADVEDSGVYLRGLSVKGSIDLSLLGSGQLKFNGWRFSNKLSDLTSILTFAFNAYPEYGKTFSNLRFRFHKLNDDYSGDVYYPKLGLDGLPIYNGKLTLTFSWPDVGLKPKTTYVVYATYNIYDNKSNTYGSDMNISETYTRWFLTTELFNEFYIGSSGVSDFCKLDNPSSFYDKMVIHFSSNQSIKNTSRETTEMHGKLILDYDANISYICLHTNEINIVTDPELSIDDVDKYPEYVYIADDKKKKVQIRNVSLSTLGSVEEPTSEGNINGYYQYSNSLRGQLLEIEGRDLAPIQGINPRDALNLSKLLETSIQFSGKLISGKIKYYDVFKAVGETISNVTNAFDKFEKVLDTAHVAPSGGHYGGVVVDFDFHGGMFADDNDHYIEVAINLTSDSRDLPGDHNLPAGWHEIKNDSADEKVTWNISDHIDKIYPYFNECVNDTDITFLYFYCPGNKFVPSENTREDATGKNGAAFTRVWWKMPSGEWACFKSLYKKSNDSNSFANFIRSQLGNKDIVYCMYELYNGNSFIYSAKENYIYYDRYNVPLIFTISYELQRGESPSSIVHTGSSCGNLKFTVTNDPKFPADTFQIDLISSEKFYDNIHSVDNESVSNVYLGNGTREDSMGRALNPNYIYYLEPTTNKLVRVDRTDFYIDAVNKTRNDGANRLLYNTNRKGTVEDKCQVAGADDTYTVLVYNSLNVVNPI